jgi:hypothetical protein
VQRRHVGEIIRILRVEIKSEVKILVHSVWRIIAIVSMLFNVLLAILMYVEDDHSSDASDGCVWKSAKSNR